jgi:hypothetical protein
MCGSKTGSVSGQEMKVFENVMDCSEGNRVMRLAMESFDWPLRGQYCVREKSK